MLSRLLHIGAIASLLLLGFMIIGCGEQMDNPVASSESSIQTRELDGPITLKEMLQEELGDEQLAKAAPAGCQTMIRPIWGRFKITREFGNVLYVPGYGWDTHTGIDIAPRSSFAWYVFAPANGVVVDVGTDKWAGKYIVIRHDTVVWNPSKDYFVKRTFTKYYHLSEIYWWVQPGKAVCQGWLLGRVGNTGAASLGAHLHFEIRENGRYGKAVNPREYIHFGDGKDIPHLA